MRCKCGFNSFDHNLDCPKCKKALTPMRRLLNLDVPAPGGINFFALAGQGMAMPQPFLEAAGGVEEYEDLQPLEDIQPVAYDVNQPLRPLAAVPAEEPVIEIEVTDDFDADPSEDSMWPEAAFANPLPGHQAAMEQIKSTLTETGDLSTGGEVEAYVPEALDSVDSAPNMPAASSEGTGDDLASLVDNLNLDDLDGLEGDL
jgi:hypothetical protein